MPLPKRTQLEQATDILDNAVGAPARVSDLRRFIYQALDHLRIALAEERKRKTKVTNAKTNR